MLRYSSSAAILSNYTNKDCFTILYENLKTMLPIQKYIECSRYELGSQNINMLQNSMFWAQVQNLVKNMVDGPRKTGLNLKNYQQVSLTTH